MKNKIPQTVAASKYPPYGTYALPKKNVFVISCIDLRLTDDTLKFLHHDNLANRFDHFTLAGASLCTCVDKNKKWDFKEKINTPDFAAWRSALEYHLQIAVDLHHIEDVYIIEHRNCGAYKEFLEKGEKAGEDPDKELSMHKDFAALLANDIRKRSFNKVELMDGEPVVSVYQLKVNCFLINLRGDVTWLDC